MLGVACTFECDPASLNRFVALDGVNIVADPDPTTAPDAADPAPDTTGNVHELGRLVETGAQRVRRLQHEAHVLAREQVEILARDLNALAQRATEIAEGGDAYPVGVRELGSRLADDLVQQAQSMLVIMERAPRG
jgi:hypothetical protein